MLLENSEIRHIDAAMTAHSLGDYTRSFEAWEATVFFFQINLFFTWGPDLVHYVKIWRGFIKGHLTDGCISIIIHAFKFESLRFGEFSLCLEDFPGPESNQMSLG